VTDPHYDAARFAARNRNIVYDTVVRAIEDRCLSRPGLTRKAIAENIGRKPSQVSAWLSGPSNWTLDTVSDLLRGVGATMEYNVVFDEQRAKLNRFNPAASPPRTLGVHSLPSIADTGSVGARGSVTTSTSATLTLVANPTTASAT